MKCPKCSYISFESTDRCRNCGYDFALVAAGQRDPDASLRDAAAVDGPLPELSLHEEETWPGVDPRGQGGSGVDLPLFNEPVPGLDDTPLISTPSPPRAPLSVRRATPDPSRLPRPGKVKPQRPVVTQRQGPPPVRQAPAPAEAPGLLDDAVEQRAARIEEPAPAVDVPQAAPGEGTAGALTEGQPAPALARLAALVVDLALLALINLAVIHFTLSVVRYPWARLSELPLLPLVAYCLMLDAGYFILLTGASGQTLGKMLAGIRVVGRDARRVPMTQAALRAALAPLCVATLGLGYLPALVGPDRRTLHDRLSHTRAIRA